MAQAAKDDGRRAHLGGVTRTRSRKVDPHDGGVQLLHLAADLGRPDALRERLEHRVDDGLFALCQLPQLRVGRLHLLGLDVEREAGAAHVSHDARHEVALLGGHLDDEARVAPRDGARGERVALALHQRRQLALRRRRKLADRKPELSEAGRGSVTHAAALVDGVFDRAAKLSLLWDAVKERGQELQSLGVLRLLSLDITEAADESGSCGQRLANRGEFTAGEDAALAGKRDERRDVAEAAQLNRTVQLLFNEVSLCRLLLQCLALRLVGGHREARTNGCAALPRTRERSDLAREPGPLQELKRRRLGRGEGLSSERVLCGLRGLLILDARWRVRRRMRTCFRLFITDCLSAVLQPTDALHCFVNRFEPKRWYQRKLC
mmetsp:Transcript_9579/g.18741  ORF Transcript_9579/g.18741 Transcript_9579/m.18741 type:complete len:378 (+) Transcript_9579:1729-2862(+)